MRWVALDCYTAAAGLCGRWGGVVLAMNYMMKTVIFQFREWERIIHPHGLNISTWRQNRAPASWFKREVLQLKRFFTRFLFIELLLFLWVSNPFVLALMPPSTKNFVSHESAKLGGSLGWFELEVRPWFPWRIRVAERLYIMQQQREIWGSSKCSWQGVQTCRARMGNWEHIWVFPKIVVPPNHPF